jgi:MarR family transcriptional regulator, repressor for mepA
MRNDEIGFLIKRIHDGIYKKANLYLKQQHLTLTQTRVLSYLLEHQGEKTSQKDIEEHFAVAHPTVVGILKRLECKGFIACGFEKGSRLKYVYLTKCPEALAEDMGNNPLIFEEELLEGLSKEDINELRRLLGHIYQNIKE